jgi:ketosteroid isomerase-like protein
MSQENVEIIKCHFENTNARNFRAVMDTYADDVVLRIQGDQWTLLGDGAVGKEAVGQWFGEWFATFERDYRFEVHESRDLGERVLIVATHHGRGRASGAPTTLTAAWVYTLRDGKIVRCDMFGEPSEALKAMGLEE